jgi:DNA-directed RNA polymerase specialized sigma subunit
LEEKRIIEDSTFVELTKFNMQKLYKQYVKSYLKLKKYANKIMEEYINTVDKDKQQHRRIVYDARDEMLETIILLERYLKPKERYYTMLQELKLKRLTYDKKSDIGFTPINQYIKEVDEIVENRILANEMLAMMKALLTDKQYACTYMYFWGGMTQQEIADKLGMTRQNVALHIDVSINKFRNSEYFSSLLENLF